MPIKNRFAELLPEITAWRQDFHQHPELMYELHRTAARVAELLRAFGCDEVVEGIGRTGVVGVIKGRETGSGKVTGLRADMDALPITEITGLPYASQTPGVMHACGHDGHTAMLLGAAKYLCETRNFDGTVVCLFQPAEEGGAGAKAMIDDGVMERWNIQEVYGMHNDPGTPAGTYQGRSGAVMASADQMEIIVKGKGGHAAMPHNTIDTALVACQIVVGLQSIVSRNIDPLKSVVISVCSIETDSPASNVIPNTVKMRGTIRTLDPAMRDLAETRIKAFASTTAEAFGATAVVDYLRGYPVTMNHPDQTEFALAVAEEVTGPANRNPDPTMGAEDFAYMLEARPGAYLFLGNGDTAQCHHPAYNFDDNIIPAGCSWFATLVERRMPLNQA